MAMVTPIGSTRTAFDATKSAIFSFTSVGGDRVVANELKIYNNETGVLVYSHKEETYSFNQTLSANTLSNDVVYNFTFTTYDVDDNASQPSEPVLFYCYTTPTFGFTNISSDQRISTSSYNFILKYSQNQGELVSYVTYYLYDRNNVLVKQSDDIYNTSSDTTVTFEYLINGLENNESYYIQAKGLTLNGFQLSTDEIPFSVRYEYPTVFTNLEVINMCDDGYNKIISNMVALNGHSYPTVPTYRNNKKLDLLDIIRQKTVWWESDTIVDGDFGMQIWFECGLEGKQFQLTSVDNPNTYMIGRLNREIPYSQTQAFDYAEITGYVDGIEKFYIRSNYVEEVNNLTYIILTFKYAPSTNTYDLQLHTYDRVATDITWRHYSALYNNIITSDGDYIVNDNDEIISDIYGYGLDIQFEEAPLVTDNDDNIINEDSDNVSARLYEKSSNAVYNRLTDRNYNDDLNIVGVNKPNQFDMGDILFPIGKVQLWNGIYDHMEIYKDYNREYSSEYSEWSYNTYFLCNFNNNINAGTIDYVVDEIESVRVKARKVGKFNYVTLYDIPINTPTDLNFEVYDYRVPNDVDIEYALVVVYNGGIEGQYSTKTIHTKWRRLFISDSTMTLDLIGNVAFSDVKKNSPRGVLQPIDNIYPIVVHNGTVNYYSGTISGTLLCKDFSMNRKEIVDLRTTWSEFLANGNTKIIKDWNGYIILGQIVGDPTMTFDQNYGNGMGNISFSFVEQGKWDNQQDLYELGIVDTL